jgi:hypothetical protein
MFRKVAIVVLSFLALATLTIAATSDTFRLNWGSSFNIPDRKPGYLVGFGDRQVGFAWEKPLLHDQYPPAEMYHHIARVTVLSFYNARTHSLSYHVCFPLWMPSILFAVYLGISALRALVKRTPGWRRRHGLCVRCGYDLTGNTSGVCPECGVNIGEL